MIALLAIFFGFIAIMSVIRAIRRRRRPAPPAPSPSFDLAELHAMRDAGNISQAEFDRLKAIVSNQAASAQAAPMKGARGFDVLPPKPPAA